MIIKISKHSLEYWGKYCPTPTWTSVSDIGQSFSGKKLTLSEYMKYENKYCEIIKQFFEKCNISKMFLGNLESHSTSIEVASKCRNALIPAGEFPLKYLLSHHRTYDLDSIEMFFRLILRECFWARIEDKAGNFIHVGHDYYFYIGSPLIKSITDISFPEGIYYQEIDRSPYSE